MKAAVRTLAVLIADGKTFTASNTLTLAGTDGSTLNIGAGGTLGSGAFIEASPLDSPAFTGVPTAPTAAPGTNTTQLATTAFTVAEVAAAVTGLLDFKGDTDASTNPNYPAASKGDAYYITVAGKIGGASGKSVEIGDVVVAKADNAGGTEAAVGTSWFVLEHNLAGALVTANALSELTGVASTARTNLGLGTLATQSGTFSGTSSGTNTGDQASIVGITGSLAEFNTALTGADFATGGGTATGTNTGDQTTVSGNAGTATALQTARNINGVAFDGTADVTVTAAAGTLSGATLAAGVLASSLTSTGTLTGGATGAGFTVALGTSTLTGTVPHGNLGTGGGGATKFLREDSTFQTVSGSGDVVGPASAVDNRVVFFDSTSGKLIKDSGLLLSGSNTGDQTTVSGNAGTATALQTARDINGVSFNGTVNITVAAAAGTLTGATLAAGVTASSLTSVGTLGSLTVTNDLTVTTGKFLGIGTVRNEATYLALEASTPLYKGQLASTEDGYVFRSYGTTANDWSRVFAINDARGSGGDFGFTFGANITYFGDAQIYMQSCNELQLGGRFFAAGTVSQSIPHQFYIKADTYSDSVLHLVNLNPASYTGLTMARDWVALPGEAAFAIGNENTASWYRERLFIATNPPSNDIDADAIPITFAQEHNDVSGFTSHYRLNFRADTQDILCYGWTTGVIEGPTAWYVAPDGRMGVGTETLATGAQLTINGAIAVGNTSVYTEADPTTSNPVGFGAVGISSTGILRRFEVGIQVGGSAANPGEPVSRIGTGVDVRSADAIGIRVSEQASGIVTPVVSVAGSGYHTPPLITTPAAPAGGITALVSAYMTETSLHQTAAQITATTGGTGYTASQVVPVTFANPLNITGRGAMGTLLANGSGVIAAATAVVFGGSATGTVATNSAGVVTSVVLSAGGSAFPKSQAEMPVSFVASGNRTAGGTAATNSSGVITSLSMGLGGTGYTASQGALAITIDAFGAKYGTLPAATVEAPVTGITPRVTAKLNPTSLAQILVYDPGSKYIVGGSFTVDNTGTGGTSAAGTYSVVSPTSGRGIYEYRMTLVGAGYNPNSLPAVTVAVPPSGTTATAQATVNARGQVTNITALIPGGPTTVAGTGYGVVPAVTVAAPAPVTATGTASQTGGIVDTLTLTQGGSGYFATTIPTVTINGTAGTGATAVVKTIVAGVITELQLTAGGSGYTGGAWAITISAPPAGVTATAVAVLGGRAIHVEPEGGDVLIESQFSASYVDELIGKEWRWQNLPNATTVSAIGITALTETGTVSAVAEADGYWKQFANSSINIVNGVTATTFAIARRDHLPVMTAYIKIGAAITNSRTWFAYTSAILSGKDVPTTEHVCGFRYASVTDTTAFWRVVTAAGSTPTTIITPFPIAINTTYKLTIDMSILGVARFYINGQLAAFTSLTLPTDTTALGLNCSTTNVTATAHELKISYIRGKTKA